MNDLNPIGRESLLREVQKSLPDPIREEAQDDGSITFIGGDPGEVIVRIRERRISVAEYFVRWEGHTPVVHPMQIAALNWKRVPASAMVKTLHELIELVCRIRRAKYRKCQWCGKIKTA